MRSLFLTALVLMAGCLGAADGDTAGSALTASQLDETPGSAAHPALHDEGAEATNDHQSGSGSADDRRQAVTYQGPPVIDMDTLHGHRVGVQTILPAIGSNATGTLQASVDGSKWTERYQRITRPDMIRHDGSDLELPVGDGHKFWIRTRGIDQEITRGIWTITGLDQEARQVRFNPDSPLALEMEAPGAFLVSLDATLADGTTAAWHLQGFWAAAWTIMGTIEPNASPNGSVPHRALLEGVPSQFVTVQTMSTSDSQVGLVGRSLVLATVVDEVVNCQGGDDFIPLKDDTDHFIEVGDVDGQDVEVWLGGTVPPCDPLLGKANAEPVPYRLRVAVKPLLVSP